jgi:hypothetical protein
MVALTESGLVVGSEAIYGVTQTSIAVWGNDSQTTEVDGALANEVISFQLVNGADLYDVVLPSAVTFVGNGLSIQNAAAQLTLVECESSTILGCMDAAADNYNMDATEDDGSCTYIVLGCMDAAADNYNMDATEDDGSCEFDEPETEGCDLPIAFEGNTGANMSLMLTSPLVESLNITDENAYLVALTESGLLMG